MTRPIWIDTDPGFDDLVALVVASRSPELRLEGIGVVAGNAPLSATLENTLRIADAFGIEAPIYTGCDRPLVQTRKTAEDVLGKGALGTVGQSLPSTSRKPDTGHAVLELIEAARRMPGELNLIAIGPLTNVALAMRLEPALPQLLREVIWMGGSTERGNDTPADEFNAYADPEAAQVVFASGAKLSMFGLNLTRQVNITRKVVESVRLKHQVLADHMEHYLRIRESRGHSEMPLHDPCTVAYLLRPQWFELLAARVDVELSGLHSRGMTVCELRVPERAQANASVAFKAQGEAVMDLVLERLLSKS